MNPIARRGVRGARSWPAMLASLLLLLVALVVVVDLAAFYVFDQRRVGHASSRFFRFSGLLGWEHRPGAEGTWYAYKDGTRTQVSINPYGFPDKDRSASKTGTRIALIGDSTAEFWEIPEPRRGHRLLEERLGGAAEVLNFGLRGAGTDQLYLRLGHEVIHFAPDIVIYLFCVNDISNNVSGEGKPYFVLDDSRAGGVRLEGYPLRFAPSIETPWPWGLLEQSFTLRTLKYRTLGVQSHLRVDVPLVEHFELRPFKAEYDAEEARRMALLRRLIAAFARAAADQGQRFLLVEGVYRPALDPAMMETIVDAYGDRFEFDKVTRQLTEWSVADGYEFLSLQGLVRERGLDVRALMHPEDTTHLGPGGAEFFARAVAERLVDMGWVQGRDAIDVEAAR